MVSEHRDRTLADQLMALVKACGVSLGALLVVTDGWSADPGRLRRAFREKVNEGTRRGRSRLVAWPAILIGMGSKRTHKKRVVEGLRRMTPGCDLAALVLLRTSGGRQ